MLRGEFVGKNKIVASVKQSTAEGEPAALRLDGVMSGGAVAQEPVGAGHAGGT